MAGIAGIAEPGRTAEVNRMLDAIVHRGRALREVQEVEGVTMGIVRPAPPKLPAIRPSGAVEDSAGAGHFAQARVAGGRLVLRRDRVGVAPLYHGRTAGGALCFASEVKALVDVASEIYELPPGHTYDGETSVLSFHLAGQAALTDSPASIAGELRRRLEVAVRKRVTGDLAGAWLSGGLDSSTMVALARPIVPRLHTFAAGLAGAKDLEYAKEVANHVKSEHHERLVTLDEMRTALPRVIHHLESFDALLVRSSIMNFLVAGLASDHVPSAFSGEGGDELFAGYDYLKALDPSKLAGELEDITGRLHNTALQRVDRCASAHGLVAHVCFLDPDVVEYALRIPVALKIREGVEKWILREAIDGMLPERVLKRPKAKFWEGSGVGDLMADLAEKDVSDDDFRRHRALPNGWLLNTKEEMVYYRLFREHFGTLTDLSWMGRTKGAPVTADRDI